MNRLLIVLAATGVLWSQVETGLIDGSVADPPGAAIPNADIDTRSISTDLSLSVQSNEAGDATERVTVEASTVQLESETLGNIRPERAVAELPLNARNFATFIFLSPGTVAFPLAGTQAVQRRAHAGLAS